MKIGIIGAGISGLYLAWKLTQKGYKVTVFEKRKKIGKEVCSGLFSERILDFIPHLREDAGFIPQSQNLIKNQIDYCLIHFPKKTIKIKFSKKFLVINHSQLDRLVASLAKKSGVKIILNQNISSLPEGFEKIIGCDGALSQVRKILGLRNPKFNLGIQGFISKKNNSNFVETWPTEQGFFWKIPRGKEIEYGILGGVKEAKKNFESFLKEKNIYFKKINSALIPQGLIIPQNQKITLLGDAAGLTKPWSGGGVVWSLISADILLKNFPDFIKYKKETEKFFMSKIIFSKMAKKLVYFLGSNFPFILPKEFKIDGDFLI